MIALRNALTGEVEYVRRADLLDRTFQETVRCRELVEALGATVEQLRAEERELAKRLARKVDSLERKGVWALAAALVVGGGGLAVAGRYAAKADKHAQVAARWAKRSAVEARAAKEGVQSLDQSSSRKLTALDGRIQAAVTGKIPEPRLH